MTQEKPDDTNDLLEVLRARCEAGRVELEVKDYGGDVYCVCRFPNGRNNRRRTLYGQDELEALLAIPFEDYVYLGDFEAICCYEAGEIEAGIKIPHGGCFHAHLVPDGEAHWAERVKPLELVDAGFASGCRIVIGLASEAYNALRGRSHALTLRLRNFTISNHDKALSLLERVANSLFFQIELEFNSTLALERTRRRPNFRRRFGTTRADDPTVTFPSREFDQGPITLYWYAVGARGMLLLVTLQPSEVGIG